MFALTFAIEFLGADGEQTLDDAGKRRLGHMRVLLERWHEQGTWGLGGDCRSSLGNFPRASSSRMRALAAASSFRSTSIMAAAACHAARLRCMYSRM